MARTYISKNRVELEKNAVEREKNLISKVDTLRILLEANKPDNSSAYSEFSRYTSVWEEDESSTIKDKLMELINDF